VNYGKNGLLDLHAVWGDEWGQSKDGCIIWGSTSPSGGDGLGFLPHCLEWRFEGILKT